MILYVFMTWKLSNIEPSKQTALMEEVGSSSESVMVNIYPGGSVLDAFNLLLVKTIHLIDFLVFRDEHSETEGVCSMMSLIDCGFDIPLKLKVYC